MYLRYKQKLFIAITLIIVVCLVVSSAFVYYEFFDEDEEKTIEEEEPIVTDDRISPLADQTVSLEISRIRKRGIEEIMRTPGRAWKSQPTYYYKATLNDATLTSEPISGWDTKYVSWEFFRDVENEMETCPISIEIVETEKKLLRTLEESVLTINLEYNFRTGRWTGDDSFNDSDGYGHYLDENYEIWFDMHMSDNDADGIPYWTENNLLNTDPMVDDTYLDPDGDGIPTVWEWKWGYDPHVFENHTVLDPDLDGLQNTEEYMMEEWLANPYQPEIYIEVDFMEGKTLGPDYVMWEESAQMVIDKFADHNYEQLNYSSTYCVHFDDGCMGGGGELLPHVGRYIDQADGTVSEFYKHNFDDARKGVFRYLVMVYDAGWAHPQDYKGWYDTMAIGASQNFYLQGKRGRNFGPRVQRIVQAVQIMHETGHTLNLMPDHSEGIDNASLEAGEYWYNYKSCMNYWKMYRPLPSTRILYGKDDGLILDYSDGSRDEPNQPDKDDWGHLDLTFFQQPSHLVEGIELNENGIPISQYRKCCI